MRTLVCLMAVGSALLLAQPVVNEGGVLNAASYALPKMPNYGIAQGSMFVVFGRNLGPAGLVQAGSFPLPANLGGTSVRVSVGGTAADAILLYTTMTQVAGILPSRVPVGDGTLTVSYQGRTSAPVRIRMVPNAFGIFTLNEAGSGPGIVQNVISATEVALNTPIAAAAPEQVMMLWGTGLGAVSWDETVPPKPADLKDLSVPVELYVGGKRAEVLYKGRSGGFPGIDQINFRVPKEVEGCYVPVGVRVGGVVSNFASIAVSSRGKACSDAHGLAERDVERIRGGGTLDVGWIQLIRLNARLSAPGLGSVNGSVDFGFGDLYRWNPDSMVRSEGLNPAGGNPFGSCTVLGVGGEGPTFAPRRPNRLRAGPVLTVTGPKGTRPLPRRGSGLYDKQPLGAWASGDMGVPPGLAQFLEPGAYTVDNGAGGQDVGPFRAAVTLPGPPQWTNRDSLSTIDRSQDLTVTWTGADADKDYVLIAGGTILPTLGPDTEVGGYFLCTERAAAGRLTVPSLVLSALPASTPNEPMSGLLAIAVASLPERVRFTARGLDTAFLTYTVADIKNVTYR